MGFSHNHHHFHQTGSSQGSSSSPGSSPDFDWLGLVLMIGGGIAAVLLVVWILSIIWPYIVGAILLIAAGTVLKGSKGRR